MSIVLSPGDVKLRDGRSVDFANLDIAATAPCLRVVADAVAELLPFYGSVHRGAGALSERCTREYEQARETVADLLGCGAGDTVVFTRNTTDAFNLLARALPAGTTVVTFDTEHHANLLPWADVVRLPAPRSAEEAVASLTRCLYNTGKSTLVSVTAASNVTGELWPVARLAAVAHRFGARIAVDAAQLAPHAPVSLAELGADYVAFSGHKIYAPFGAGVLVGRADWLDAAEPYLAGGGASANVAADGTVRWATGPARHEAGTPNLLGAVALATALRALHDADTHEQALVNRLRAGLAGLPHVEELRLFGPEAPRVGIVSFAVAGEDPGELAVRLGRDHGIGVRTGLFCAHPLTRRLLAEAATRLGAVDVPTQAVRASLGLGTTAEHVDRLLAALDR
ncbi:aminotransferase class V-fold PLP-dependent enzyme [Dactylosporangium sucinum]|uniref:Cysteine desulfurase n=1 Tax=Dactylosporangium sucinum TaxID=1424081 RepID=A0A917X4E7_9ACTN|nr:aminotransferase class V-fold PLP-dependent enzyme [Dactylosporangium sucinum]GGM70931.1 cysteine desulfurase [Dactylosporangium sucinum]